MKDSFMKEWHLITLLQLLLLTNPQSCLWEGRRGTERNLQSALKQVILARALSCLSQLVAHVMQMQH